MNATATPAPQSAPTAPAPSPACVEFPTEAETAVAKDEALDLFRQIAAARRACPAVAEVNAALAHMRGTERGATVLRDFAHLLNKSALGLDIAHWTALETLVRACKGGIGPEVRDAILERSEVRA